MVDTYTVWACTDCLHHYANGECGSCHGDHGHDREPLSLAIAEDVTMGMLAARHDCYDEENDSREDECDCETINHSYSSCELCGSHLHGERHAFTIWV